MNVVTSFDYTQMPEAAEYLHACHPILFIKSNGSFLCKNNKKIYFNKEDCAKLLQTSLQLRTTPVTVQQLNDLPDNTKFHATKNLGGPVIHQSSTCVAIVSQPILDILNSIFVSTAFIFHH